MQSRQTPGDFARPRGIDRCPTARRLSGGGGGRTRPRVRSGASDAVIQASHAPRPNRLNVSRPTGTKTVESDRNCGILGAACPSLEDARPPTQQQWRLRVCQRQRVKRTSGPTEGAISQATESPRRRRGACRFARSDRWALHAPKDFSLWQQTKSRSDNAVVHQFHPNG